MKVRAFIDGAGWRRAEVDGGPAILGWFLEQDVQNSVRFCDELLEIIRQIRDGILSEWEGTGNAHTLSLLPTGARIVNEFTDPTILADMTLSDVEEAITDWKEFLVASGQG